MCASPRSLLLVLVLSSLAAAQSVRFRDEVFTQVDVLSDIAYGAAVNVSSGLNETLLLDRYQPVGDSLSGRPAVVVVHGGGFVAGDKGDPDMVRLSEQLARAGYVAVSINYRLLQPGGGGGSAQNVLDLQADVKAAVRFLRSMAGPWRIDETRIAAIGASAGAILSLAAAYLPEEGQSGSPGFSSELQAVVSLWGALDPAEIEAGEAPVCVIHGTNDRIVPYARGVAVHQQALAVGIPTELHAIQGAGHSPYPTFFSDHYDDVLAFYWEQLKLGQLAGLSVAPGAAAPGSVTIEATGVAGDLRWLGVSFGATALEISGLGTLCLDPSSLALLEMPMLPAMPRLASSSTSFAIPSSAAGLTLWVQEVHAGPGSNLRVLTNCHRIDF